MLDCLQLAAVSLSPLLQTKFRPTVVISDVYNANRNTMNFGAGLGNSVSRLGYCFDGRGTVV